MLKPKLAMPKPKKLPSLKKPAIAVKFAPTITKIKGNRTLSGMRKGLR
jgi:hypothetical protein